ncbi:MAG: CYTH domain-containing protein [Solirubrobacteraceae bacterium]
MEIERKFLVSELPPDVSRALPAQIEQGYLVIGPDGSEARVRRTDGAATLTVKSGGGLSRHEAEIELSDQQFETLWPATESRRVVKTRYRLEGGDDLTIELDVYTGSLEGLLVAEVEFPNEAAAAAFAPPPWFATEVTEDDAYKNRRLATDGRP